MMNKKKKIAITLASLGLVCALGVGSTLMFFTDKAEKTNVVTMGKVDAELTETSPAGKDDNGKDLITGTEKDDQSGFNYDKILPGDSLSKMPTITMDADSEDAYVRVKVEVTGDITDAQKADVEAGLNIDAASWVKGTDGYYYLQNVMSKGDSVNFFTYVAIPSTWDNTISSKDFNIVVKAELIQAANFDTNLVKDAAGKINGWINTGDIKEN